jgi:hypothetical protein
VCARFASHHTAFDNCADNTEPQKNYEQTMLDVKQYLLQDLQLPVRLFNSSRWFEYYAPATSTTQIDNGTVILCSLSLALQIQYFQFDSWWYYKVGGNVGKGAVTLWEPMPDIFPDLMSPTWLDMPLVLHNR